MANYELGAVFVLRGTYPIAGYDADRLGRDPAMRWIVGGKAIERGGASTSQMGQFGTELLSTNDNLVALTNLLGVWIDAVHGRKPLKSIVLEWIARSVQPVVARRGQPISVSRQAAERGTTLPRELQLLGS